MKKPQVSIIIRTQNEERWIVHCLNSVFSQKFKDFEVIIVDDNSTDGTLKKAKQFPVKIVKYTGDYKPGKALNLGVENSSGKYIAFLSGHCIPVDSTWLDHLISAFKKPEIAGVYGRQQPMSFSSPHDKRDLLITFGLDKKIQQKDTFFHNANSAIKREVWNKIPFDETVSNIEDRIWASNVLEKGYKILYEPEASVYHHHGIHHNGDTERAASTVQVIEKIQRKRSKDYFGKIDPKKLKIISLIPVKGELIKFHGEPILKHALDASFNCDLISDTIVLTDNEEVASFATDYGANVPFLRDTEHSKDYVGISMVYSYYLEKLESLNIYADLVVSIDPKFIFRPPDLIKKMIMLLLENDYDSVVPVTKYYNPTWIEKDGEKTRADAGNIPRHLKNPLLVSAVGLGLVTHPEFLREGKLLGDNCGLFEVDSHYTTLEIRNEQDTKILQSIIDMAREGKIIDPKVIK